MSRLKRIMAEGDTVPTTATARGAGLAGFRVLAHGRTVGYVLLAVVAISVAAHLAVPIAVTPVPVSLQDLVVMLIGVVLGPVAGTSAAITYLAVGAAGAPVFSNGHAGLAWLFGPTGGYLLAYPAACWVVGLATRQSRRTLLILGGVVLAQALIYGGGMLQLMVLTGRSAREVAGLAVAPFIPGAVLKIAVIVAFVGVWRGWRARRRPVRDA